MASLGHNELISVMTFTEIALVKRLGMPKWILEKINKILSIQIWVPNEIEKKKKNQS